MSSSKKITFPSGPGPGGMGDDAVQPTTPAPSDAALDSLPPPTLMPNGHEPEFQMAAQLRALKYHPVVIFGNSASGKTSLITSLLAALKLEPEWEMGAILNDPVVPQTTDYGRAQQAEANRLFNRVVQEFIAGRGAEATKTPVPFFVPMTVRSGTLNQSLKLAFMESNGESYAPDLQSDNYFAALRKDTEAFVRDYEGSISFIYVLPYTQINVRALNESSAEDPARLRLAELAVAGALQAYERIRIHKNRDSHLLLVSKWDAHYDTKKQDEEVAMSEVLSDTYADVEVFLRQTYPQALSNFQSLSAPKDQRLVTNYCAGLMTGRTIQPLTEDLETRAAIRANQKKVWRWVWASALGYPNGQGATPFPSTDLPPSLIDRFFAWLSRLF